MIKNGKKSLIKYEVQKYKKDFWSSNTINTIYKYLHALIPCLPLGELCKVNMLIILNITQKRGSRENASF